MEPTQLFKESQHNAEELIQNLERHYPDVAGKEFKTSQDGSTLTPVAYEPLAGCHQKPLVYAVKRGKGQPEIRPYSLKSKVLVNIPGMGPDSKRDHIHTREVERFLRAPGGVEISPAVEIAHHRFMDYMETQDSPSTITVDELMDILREANSTLEDKEQAFSYLNGRVFYPYTLQGRKGATELNIDTGIIAVRTPRTTKNATSI